MEINFEITEEDYIEFNLYHIENSPSQKRTYNILRYILPIVFSIPIYAAGTALWKQPKIYWIIVSLLFIIIWSVTYPKQHKKLIKKETRKLIDEGDNSSIFGKKTMVIEEDNIKVIGEFITETISRKSIQNIKIYDDMIAIYLSAFTAQIIPVRYLDKESKENLLNELNVINS